MDLPEELQRAFSELDTAISDFGFYCRLGGVKQAQKDARDAADRVKMLTIKLLEYELVRQQLQARINRLDDVAA